MYKNRKKLVYALILTLLVAGGWVFAKRELNKDAAKTAITKPLTDAELAAERKKWEANPENIKFKKWEASLEGKKVDASAAKIRKNVREFSYMEGVVTSLSLPADARLGFGIMVKINGDDYILTFGQEKSAEERLKASYEFKQLHALKVNDKIRIKSHYISKAPKYAYPIVAGDQIEQNGKVIFKRAPNQGGC